MSDLRKIDALIAEHVFGWKREMVTLAGHSAFGTFETPGLVTPDGKGVFAFKYPYAGNNAMPHYSTDIALAIGVLDRLVEQHKIRYWKLTRNVAGSAEVCTGHFGLPPRLVSASFPEMICKHVLAVLGVEVPHD